ncbi:SDR family NAD(P)-dependent oxidoreductase [Deinococcus apachensis]|uniref:SDR family NAD(P)-dependent oxidoreductase n=1 Tax=Deinococcus apachensis TaxID=309886 RepID=UPI0003802790|nr:SDR family oxidoreductase [Deinococcus apachensis]
MDYATMFRLDGKVALLVGGGSGIGEASAHALAANGAHVVVADLNGEAASRTANAIRQAGYAAEGLPLDLTDAGAVEGAVAGILRGHGRLDIGVSSPSINVRKPLLDYTPEEFERVLRVNMGGTFNVLRSAGRAMADGGGGSLIAFSSVRSQVVEPGQSVYAATKAGTLQLLRGLASELGGRGVRANAVAPGVIDTPLTAPIKNNPQWADAYAQKSVFGRWGRPEELAGAVVYLASEAASFVTGTILFVDGGWTSMDGRFTPPL